MQCSKCGDPDIVTSWKSCFHGDKIIALCQICYERLSRDAKTVNDELLREREEE